MLSEFVILSTLLAVGPGLPGASPQTLPAFVFASPEQGRELLTRRDDYVQRLSPFDRAARLKTDRDVDEGAFLAHVAGSVRAWTEAEQALVSAALAQIREPLARLALPWPATVRLIRTSGAEEGGAPYTRGDAVVLPAAVFAPERLDDLAALLLHEIFHVLSRHNPALKQALYGAIGFRHCGEVALPASLQAIRITNPDAPINDYCIRLRIEGRQVDAIPLLLAEPTRYDPARGGEFFDYLRLRFYFTAPDGRRFLAEPDEVSDFFEQVGRNTSYILHPEEILADNFALLVQQRRDLPSPQILAAMAKVLAQH